MKMNVKSIWGVLLRMSLPVIMAAVAMSCSKEHDAGIQRISQDKFLTYSALGVYDSDMPTVVFNSDCQIAFNSARNKFRLQSDNQAYFAEIVMSEFPSDNAWLHIDINMRVDAASQPSDLTDEVMVVKSEGNKYWLWSSATSIGYIVMIEP